MTQNKIKNPTLLYPITQLIGNWYI